MSTTTPPRQHPTTEALHKGDGIAPHAKPLTTPIYETTTFLFESADEVRRYQEGQSAKYLYSRYANPTVQAAEAKLATYEQAEAALVFGAGMAATATTVMALTKQGDEVLCSAAIYGGTLHLLHDILERFGVTTRFLSLRLAVREQLVDLLGQRPDLGREFVADPRLVARADRGHFIAHAAQRP